MKLVQSEQLVINPTEFFRERVTEASCSLKVSLGDQLEFYIVQLLCDFISPHRVQEVFGEDQDFLGTPLVLMLQKAFESESPEQKIQMLKSLGDTSLYIAGYFQDYFNRKTFDISYYMELGSIAYSNAAKITRQRKDQSVVFCELADNFPQLVDVVAEVSGIEKPVNNQDVLAIYDRWARSNSDRLRKILNNMGIDPVSNIPIKIAQ